MMRAVVVDRWLGGPEELAGCVQQAPSPELDSGCVKISVAAAGASALCCGAGCAALMDVTRTDSCAGACGGGARLL